VTEYVINSHCYLTINENYWGPKAKIKNLRFRVIDEPAQIVNAIEMGSVDVATIPLQDVDFVKSLPEYKIDLISNGSVSVLQFNTTTLSLLNSRDARRAVCHAIDKEAIVNLTYYGYASIPSWSLSTNLVDYNESFSNMDETYSIGYDVELAKQYAEQAGIVGKEIRIVTNGSTTAVTTAEIMQQNLADIGVNAVITNYDPASFFSISLDTSAYDIYLFSYWVPSFTAAQNYNGWVYRLPNYNEGTWEGIERVMELASDLTSVFDSAERQTAINEITEVIQREAIWYAINEPQTVIAYNTDLGGVEFMQNLNTYYGDWYWTA
jgi:peptide/nickel transport system substrate-binding protein